jgi:predicted lysophospholipase L1 biosynthesis ABC-type transport system permease subunit
MSVYLAYPARALARERQQTVLGILCVSIGVMAIVALQLIGAMVNTSLTGNIRGLNGGDIDLVNPRMTSAQVATFDQLQAQGLVTAFTAVATDQGAAQGRYPVARIDRIRAVDPAQFPLAGSPTFEEPSEGTLAQALSGASVVLTHDLAQQLGVHAGDMMTLTLADGRPAQVSVGGVIRNAELFQQPQLLIALDTLTALRNADAPALTYGAVYADVPGHSAVAAMPVLTQLRAQFPQGDILTTDALLRSNQEEARSIQSFLQLVALVALLIGGMGIANTMQALLRRRSLEIAMLKASGFTRRNLYALYGIQAILYGLVGGVVGAIAGVGVSLFLKDIIANAFSLTLTTTIDPLTVASGIAVGCATAFIFGLLPIVRASQVRPLALLHGLPEGVRATSRLTSILLILSLVALFFGLAFAIVRDVTTALEFVAGAAIALGLLSLVFTLAIALVGRAPVALLLPRAWKMHVKLALRNFRRQRARTVMTEISLFTGIFAVGFILLLGQGLKAQYSQPSNAIDASVGVVHLAQADAVANRLRQTAGVTRVEMYPNTGVRITAVNDVPFQTGSPFGGAGKVEGYDLAHGQTPTAPDITLDSGRLLGPADAGTTNVVIDRQQTDRSLNLALGDRIAVQFTTKFDGTPANSPSVTLTIVGFVTNNTLFADRAGNILADASVATTLAGANTEADILIHVDPQRADAVLSEMLTTYGSEVWVHNLSDVVAQEEALFNNLILALEMVILPALLAAFISIANVVALAMLERRRELGVLKAVGHTSRGVLADVLIEQGAAGVTAAALAALLALAVSQALAQKSFGVSITASTSLAAVIVLVSAGVCLLVAASAAWSATHARPLEVLRYE